jgi:hypothetical protein
MDDAGTFAALLKKRSEPPTQATAARLRTWNILYDVDPERLDVSVLRAPSAEYLQRAPSECLLRSQQGPIVADILPTTTVSLLRAASDRPRQLEPAGHNAQPAQIGTIERANPAADLHAGQSLMPWQHSSQQPIPPSSGPGEHESSDVPSARRAGACKPKPSSSQPSAPAAAPAVKSRSRPPPAEPSTPVSPTASASQRGSSRDGSGRLQNGLAPFNETGPSGGGGHGNTHSGHVNS